MHFISLAASAVQKNKKTAEFTQPVWLFTVLYIFVLFFTQPKNATWVIGWSNVSHKIQRLLVSLFFVLIYFSYSRPSLAFAIRPADLSDLLPNLLFQFLLSHGIWNKRHTNVYLNHKFLKSVYAYGFAIILDPCLISNRFHVIGSVRQSVAYFCSFV